MVLFISTLNHLLAIEPHAGVFRRLVDFSFSENKFLQLEMTEISEITRPKGFASSYYKVSSISFAIHTSEMSIK